MPDQSNSTSQSNATSESVSDSVSVSTSESESVSISSSETQSQIDSSSDSVKSDSTSESESSSESDDGIIKPTSLKIKGNDHTPVDVKFSERGGTAFPIIFDNGDDIIFEPENADRSLVFSTDNPDVMEITNGDNPTMEIKKPGKATLRFASKYDASVYDEVTYNVTDD